MSSEVFYQKFHSVVMYIWLLKRIIINKNKKHKYVFFILKDFMYDFCIFFLNIYILCVCLFVWVWVRESECVFVCLCMCFCVCFFMCICMGVCVCMCVFVFVCGQWCGERLMMVLIIMVIAFLFFSGGWRQHMQFCQEWLN